MNGVKSANRVLDILEFLSKETPEKTLKQISRALNIPPSSCHALLETLLFRGYILRAEGNLAYRLGSKLFCLAAAHLDMLDLVAIADPIMAQMTEQCGHAVSLAILEGTEVVFVHKKTASTVIQVVNPIGTRLPAHATALGKVLLAALPRQAVDALYGNGAALRPLTRSTITSWDDFMRCLAETKASGVAYDWQESNEGLQAVGAAIRNNLGLPIAAVSIAVPKVYEHPRAPWERLERLVKAGAGQISATLGYLQAADAGEGALSELWRAQDVLHTNKSTQSQL